MRSGNVRSITVMMSQCYPRFSTQWATDPQQQITYVAVRKLARRYAPGAILGVYTPEELEESQPQREIDITPRAELKKEPLTCSDEKFVENKEAWKKLIESGKKTPENLIATLNTKATLTVKQTEEIRSWRPKTVVEQQEKSQTEPTQTMAKFDAEFDDNDAQE